ncbi:unnamed protein product [Dicrocoelium dendriticum]|nr:unnamed protein product [Dicrocoelium dendriticum]
MRLLLLTCYLCYLQYISATWKVTHVEKYCQDNQVVHWFKATNGTDLVYYIFAADKHVRPPAVIMIHSRYSGSKVNVNCTAYIKNDTFRNSITVEAATASYGLMLYQVSWSKFKKSIVKHQLVEFQVCDYLDLNNSAKIPDNAECSRYFGSNLKWDLLDAESADEGKLSITFAGTRLNESHDEFLDGGSIEITVGQQIYEYFFITVRKVKNAK